MVSGGGPAASGETTSLTGFHISFRECIGKKCLTVACTPQLYVNRYKRRILTESHQAATLQKLPRRLRSDCDKRPAWESYLCWRSDDITDPYAFVLGIGCRLPEIIINKNTVPLDQHLFIIHRDRAEYLDQHESAPNPRLEPVWPWRDDAKRPLTGHALWRVRS